MYDGLTDIYPPETNIDIEPENGWLEYCFQGRTVSFRECTPQNTWPEINSAYGYYTDEF